MVSGTAQVYCSTRVGTCNAEQQVTQTFEALLRVQLCDVLDAAYLCCVDAEKQMNAAAVEM